MRVLFLILALMNITGLGAQVAQIAPARIQDGQLWRYIDFPSRFVKARNVDIWLPPGYTTDKRYPVLYMQDGQMLFDSATTWNKQEWKVDENLTEMIRTGKCPPLIVVGIWNIPGQRHADYFPQKPFESLSLYQQDSLYGVNRPGGQSVFNGEKVHSDDYLRFLVKELKPFVDSVYPTKPERVNTLVAGSSMGGLISLYAICEYPDVFGGAACLSTHWPGVFSMDNNPIPGAFFQYLRQRLPEPGTHRIYFDYGDQTLDALYPPLQREVDQIMREKGFTEKNWMTLFFKGADHSEKAWAGRLVRPVCFIYPE